MVCLMPVLCQWGPYCLMMLDDNKAVLRCQTVRMIPRPAATATSDPRKWSVAKFRRREERGKKKWSSDLISLHSGRSKTSLVSWRLTWWVRTRPQRLLPPASSSLCLCFNLPTFSCISRPGVPLPWHDIEAGKHLQAFSTLLEEQNEQRNKSQTTKCNCYFKPFHFLAVLFCFGGNSGYYCQRRSKIHCVIWSFLTNFILITA